ncbi:MAG: alpha/beta hydrolase [Gemmataceae bacterium]
MRRWRRLVGLCLAGYLLLTAALLLLEDRLIFRPQAGDGRWVEPPAQLHVQEVWLQTDDGTSIHAWWCPCAKARGAALFCHGNSGNLSQRWHDVLLIRDILERSVLVFDYPGYGRSAGAPGEAGCYAAAHVAHHWLSQRVAAENILLIGQSLGGGVATELASRRTCAGLVLFKTFTSIPDVAAHHLPFLPCGGLMRNRFDSAARVGRCHAPVFIAHGDRDRLIPPRHAELLFQAVTSQRRLVFLENQGHHGSFEPDLLHEVAAFFAAAVTETGGRQFSPAFCGLHRGWSSWPSPPRA